MQLRHALPLVKHLFSARNNVPILGHVKLRSDESGAVIMAMRV